jgi:hypothetical protein
MYHIRQGVEKNVISGDLDFLDKKGHAKHAQTKEHHMRVFITHTEGKLGANLF